MNPWQALANKDDHHYSVAGFGDLGAVRNWVARFVDSYNNEHCHSNIQFVTPNQRHAGEDIAILERRKAVYEAAKAKHPARWSRNIGN